ncbi:MAG TPA: GNAT family protein [Bryobacteraceae bacterium]|jgi:RimJ/RimL family protein N-acetyltransferase|nr:GNAT family protein [Bryobacteraceae bacterium]
MECFSLQGNHIRLDPLQPSHAEPFARAIAEDPSLYEWSAVPRTEEQIAAYIQSALAGRAANTAAPFAIVRLADERVIGSTRFFDLERWSWPPGHARCGANVIDGCEIGYTWLAASAIRTAANTEAKLLLLRHAFEVWQVFRVCLHTDARNRRSAAAIERIGGKFEGVLRSHRLAVDFIPRDSLRYSILASEWPEAKQKLTDRLQRPEFSAPR